MRREPGSFYRYTLQQLTDAYPNKGDEWLRQRAREVVEAIIAAGASATIPDEAYGTSGGVALTDGLVERLADEAEAGYDVEQLRPRSRRDRPPAGAETAILRIHEGRLETWDNDPPESHGQMWITICAWCHRGPLNDSDGIVCGECGPMETLAI